MPITSFDVRWRGQVPGKFQVPVSSDHVPSHARGTVPQIGGNVLIPPYTGPDGVWIWYGPGVGVGSA